MTNVLSYEKSARFVKTGHERTWKDQMEISEEMIEGSIRKLKNELAEVREKMAALEGLAETKGRELAAFRQIAASRGFKIESGDDRPEEDESGTSAMLPPPGPKPPPLSRTERVERLRQGAHDVLMARGEPMPVQSIYDALKRRGVEITGQGTVNNLTANLTTDSRFVSAGWGTWGLAEWGSTGLEAH